MAKRVIKQVEARGFENVGDSFTGYYRGRKVVKISEKNGTREAPLYTLESENGEAFGVWGSDMLDGLMEQVEQGENVTITFVSQDKPRAKGLSGLKRYEVAVND